MSPGAGYWHPQHSPRNRMPLDRIWLRRGIKLDDGGKLGSEQGPPTNCARRFRRGGAKLLKSPIWLGNTHNPFEHIHAKEGDAEYCQVCGMFHDVTDDNCPCDHLEWCDDCGLWIGEGATDSCSHRL